MESIAQRLKFAVDIAREAGDITLEYFQTDDLAVVADGISYAKADASARLIVDITGAESDDGLIVVSLFDAQASWMKEPLHSESLPILESGASWIIEKVPYGEYAISVIHDENGNGVLDTGLFRIPTEAYGFSNNAKASFGPASWVDSKFRIESADVRIRIVLDD